MLWAGVTPMNEVYIWAEFPDIGFGDWADMSKGKKGRPGDAAKPNGYGYDDYIDRIKEVEEGITIFERLIDPRLGAAKYQGEEIQTSRYRHQSLMSWPRRVSMLYQHLDMMRIRVYRLLISF